MRAGWALRQAWALEAAGNKLCSCGHRMGGHREPRPTLAIVDGTIVETPHPEYVPGIFHCEHDGCGCRRDDRNA